jgi:hypothetical protein
MRYQMNAARMVTMKARTNVSIRALSFRNSLAQRGSPKLA